MVHFPQCITVIDDLPAGASQESVAVVFERSLDYAEFIGRQLAGRYNTYGTADAAEARELIERHRPLYVLLTADLPDADVVEFVRWCRKRLPTLATINVTTRQAALDQMALKDAGATHILPYPWGAREMYLQSVTEERVRNGPPAWWYSKPRQRRAKQQA